MADITDAFLRGHAQGQSEVAAGQAREERGLQAMVLKHHLSRLKVQDALEDYQAKTSAAGARYSAQEGQPASSFGTTTKDTLPGSVYPGGPVDPIPVTPYQANAAPAPVQFPGLPADVGGGSPGFSKTPRTAEDLIRQMVATKQMEQDISLHDIPEGGTLATGAGRVIAKGGVKPIAMRPNGVLVNPEAPPGTPPIYTAPAAPQRPVVVNGRVVSPDFRGTVPKQVDPDAAAARTELAKRAKDLQQFTTEARIAAQAHAAKVKNWSNPLNPKGIFAAPGTGDAEPVNEFPSDFETWQASKGTAAPATAAPAKGAKASAERAPAATPAAAKFEVGKPIKLRDGRTVTPTKVYPDGSADFADAKQP